MITELEIAWLAGLLEGEGCFDIQGDASPHIKLSMVDEDIVYKAAEIIGTNRIAMAKNGWLKHHKSVFHLNINGYLAMKIMRLIRPYMGERRGSKIDVIINTVLLHRPNIELGPDFCELKGHSIKHPWEFHYQTSGAKRCSRCAGYKIKPQIETNSDPNYVFVNPFSKASV